MLLKSTLVLPRPLLSGGAGQPFPFELTSFPGVLNQQRNAWDVDAPNERYLRERKWAGLSETREREREGREGERGREREREGESLLLL